MPRSLTIFVSLCVVALKCALGNDTYAVIDLFAGVGGLSYGLSRNARFEVVAANEIDPEIAKAYSLNHAQAKMYVCGIEDLTESTIKDMCLGRKIDVIVGGPPCQSYSTAGKREMDARAKLFKQYKRVLSIIRPTAFIFENVRGILSMQDGRLFKEVLNEFANEGYIVKYKVLDAADFGVPQHRERVIIVGFKEENVFEFPDPTHGHGLLPYVTLGDALGDLNPIKAGEQSKTYACEALNEYQESMRCNSGTAVTEHRAPQSGDRLIRIMETLKEGQDKFDLPEELRPAGGFANSYGKLWWDKPSGTITRNFATPSSARCIHPRDSRAMTIREGARLQSFPDDFVFYGSDSKKRLEIGNAVPPLLAYRLSFALEKALDKVALRKNSNIIRAGDK